MQSTRRQLLMFSYYLPLLIAAYLGFVAFSLGQIPVSTQSSDEYREHLSAVSDLQVAKTLLSAKHDANISAMETLGVIRISLLCIAPIILVSAVCNLLHLHKTIRKEEHNLA